MSLRALLALPLLLAGALGVRAANFNVNSAADAVDANPGNGVCATVGGACTLRAAILEANALPGSLHVINVPAGHYLLTIPGANENAGLTGDLDIRRSVTIYGAGPAATILDAGGLERVFEVYAGAVVTLDGLTIRGGNVLGTSYPWGGGLRIFGDVTLRNVVVTGNRANSGGGLDVAGTLRVERSTISENVASDDRVTAPAGGGVNAKNSTITITNSTISGNTASESGGGLAVGGSTLSMTNVTLSGNARGGLREWNSVATLTNVTILGNRENPALSHSGVNATYTLTLANTIVANTVEASDCEVSATLVVSQGGNLDSDGTCNLPASGNLVHVDPRLGPLSFGGGPTAAHTPLSGSPVLDAGALSGCPAQDQRGRTRPENGRCDIGAVEVHASDRYTATRTIPILVDRTGTAGFSSEMAIANRGSMPATLELTYTAASALSSTGAGTVAEGLSSGRQLTFDDAVGYLRGKGIPIPPTPGQGGTLRVQFSGLSSPDAGFAGARTTAPTGPGRAGLSYPGARAEDLSGNPVHLFGLRDTPADRTNLALVNAGTAGTIALRVTLYSGNSAAAPAVLADVTLGPAQWKQINAPQLLRAYGLTNAWAKVERVSGVEPFLAYAVFNDNKTDDGSYVPAVAAFRRANRLFLPVLVESDRYESELVLANPGDQPVEFSLNYVQSLGPSTSGSVALNLAAHEQRIIPGAIDFFRTSGVPVGPRGPILVGMLWASLTPTSGTDVNGFIGARTGAPAPGGGQYGLFYPALTSGETALTEAWVYGLRQDGQSRSNLAVVNLGSSAVELQIDVFDAVTGHFVGWVIDPLPSYGWNQHDSLLSLFGISGGYVRVTRTSGSGRFAAYGVTNDGASSSLGTSDGSYLAMEVVE